MRDGMRLAVQMTPVPNQHDNGCEGHGGDLAERNSGHAMAMSTAMRGLDKQQHVCPCSVYTLPQSNRAWQKQNMSGAETSLRITQHADTTTTTLCRDQPTPKSHTANLHM